MAVSGGGWVGLILVVGQLSYIHKVRSPAGETDYIGRFCQLGVRLRLFAPKGFIYVESTGVTPNLPRYQFSTPALRWMKSDQIARGGTALTNHVSPCIRLC